MKTLQEKMDLNEPLTFGEWLALCVVKFSALALACGAIIGLGQLVVKSAPLLFSKSDNWLLSLTPFLAVAALMLGLPALTKVIHDKLLKLVEALLYKLGRKHGNEKR